MLSASGVLHRLNNGQHILPQSDNESEDEKGTVQQQNETAAEGETESEAHDRHQAMSMRYSRVSTTERANTTRTDEDERKKRQSQLAERISNKLQAAFCTFAGFGLAYKTNFVPILMEDKRVNRFWFNIAVACFTINTMIMLYLTIWLPKVQRVQASWNVYCPRMIPAATVIGLICAVTLNLALWNVWGLLTPLILAGVFLGCFFSLHFVPWPC